jgi:hypothetical protein
MQNSIICTYFQKENITSLCPKEIGKINILLDSVLVKLTLNACQEYLSLFICLSPYMFLFLNYQMEFGIWVYTRKCQANLVLVASCPI